LSKEKFLEQEIEDMFIRRRIFIDCGVNEMLEKSLNIITGFED